MTIRELMSEVPAVATSDGAGVKLRRSLGSSQTLRHDPFLMLDEFFSDNPEDYLAGFPAHPHRGFETVTYMLDGHMQHQDNHGNTGDLGPGDVQWMRAASGIIHSEMPQQTQGRMRGFQLWINLPAREKMRPAAYRDIAASCIPKLEGDGGATLAVIAGRLGEGVGPIHGGSTDPYFLDVGLPAQRSIEIPLPSGHNAFIYVYDGEIVVGERGMSLGHRVAGLLSDGDRVQLGAGARDARALVLAGKPIGETVVQYGPFVMNTRAEIEQAIHDYQSGQLSSEQIGRIKISQ